MTSTVIWTPFAIGMMQTGSMVPAINVGDVMFVNRMTGVSDIAVGDIISILLRWHFPGKSQGCRTEMEVKLSRWEMQILPKIHPITAEDYIGKVDFVIESSALGLLFGLGRNHVANRNIWFGCMFSLVHKTSS